MTPQPQTYLSGGFDNWIDYQALGKINFWKDDADDEKDSDFIETNFLDFWNFVDQLKDDCWIVSWRKGVGKTTLKRFYSMQMEKSRRDVFCKEIDLSNLPKKQNLSTEEGAIELWRYFLLIELMKQVIKDESLELSIRSNIEKYLRENGYYLDDTSDLIERISIKGKVILNTLISILTATAAGISSPDIIDSRCAVTEDRWKKHLPEIEKIVLDEISKSKNSYQILIDRLDDTYNEDLLDDEKRENYLKWIAFLIKEIRALNRKLSSVSNDSKIIIFIRDDILSLVIPKVGDGNKLDESTIEIEWGESSAVANSNLKGMVEKRLTSVSDKISPVFRDDKILTDIIKHTLFRPRDVLKFLKLLQKHKGYSKACSEYSAWFYREIIDEIGAEFQGIEILDVVKRTGNQIFWIEEFRNRFSDSTKLKAANVKPEFVLRRLFEYSVIGNINRGDPPVFKYRTKKSEFRLGDRIIVHKGLHSYLGLKKTLNKHSEED